MFGFFLFFFPVTLIFSSFYFVQVLVYTSKICLNTWIVSSREDFGLFKLEMTNFHVGFGILVAVSIELEVGCGINSHLLFSYQWVDFNF